MVNAPLNNDSNSFMKICKQHSQASSPYLTLPLLYLTLPYLSLPYLTLLTLLLFIHPEIKD